jgi:branched-chain amino acid transport system permease protein
MFVGVDGAGIHVSMKDTSSLGLAADGKIIIKGAQGITGTPKLSTFTIGIVLVLITLIIVLNLMNSRTGRAVMAIRDNRIAAESIGIDIAKTKMMAFVISASLAGAAGALYGLNYSTMVASKFDYNTSILILVYVVLGGLGNINGTLIATVVLFLLPQLLRGLQDYRMLIYAVILILIMLVTNNEYLKTKFSVLRRKKA